MTELQMALHGLTQAIDAPRHEGRGLGNWRWTVRQRMASVREGLARETADGSDSWLAARESSVLRDRNALMTRLTVLGQGVLEAPEVEQVRVELKRLVTDIQHHRQKLHDLAYDAVELELGGSE
jgi:hypothetical protein